MQKASIGVALSEITKTYFIIRPAKSPFERFLDGTFEILRYLSKYFNEQEYVKIIFMVFPVLICEKVYNCMQIDGSVFFVFTAF